MCLRIASVGAIGTVKVLIAATIYPQKIEAQAETEDKARRLTDDESDKPRTVRWRFPFEEQLGPNNVARTVRNKALQQVSTRHPIVAYWLTIAFTVVFLVNPPKLPDTMDMSSGNEAELAPIRQVPAYRPHLSPSGNCRTKAAPTSAMEKVSIIQYVRVFLR